MCECSYQTNTKFDTFFTKYRQPIIAVFICHNTCETECNMDNTDQHSSVSTEMLCHNNSFDTVLVESCRHLSKSTLGNLTIR